MAGLGQEDRFRIHLNPSRSRSRFMSSALLDEGATPPADVEFFAVCDTLDEWVGRRGHGRTELAALARDLAEIGLVAAGRDCCFKMNAFPDSTAVNRGAGKAFLSTQSASTGGRARTVSPH